MNKVRRRLIFILLGIIIFLFGGYITLDWFQFLSGITNHSSPEIPYVRYTKVASVYLMFLLVLLIDKKGVIPGDKTRLFKAFIFIAIGEAFLLFDQNLMGIPFFGIVHILFALRHLKGIDGLIQREGKKTVIFQGTGLGILLLSVYLIFCFVILLPISGFSILFIFIMFYGLIVITSLWSVLMALNIRLLPRTNGLLAAIGILFMFLSDLTVGINFTMAPSSLRSISNFSTWIFYAPGILLVALSGFSMKRLFPDLKQKTEEG